MRFAVRSSRQRRLCRPQPVHKLWLTAHLRPRLFPWSAHAVIRKTGAVKRWRIMVLALLQVPMWIIWRMHPQRCTIQGN